MSITNTQGQDVRTPLMIAIIITFLLVLFPLALIAEDKEARLMNAAKEGNLNGVKKKMIAKGASLDTVNEDGLTALILASRYDHIRRCI